MKRVAVAVISLVVLALLSSMALADDVIDCSGFVRVSPEFIRYSFCSSGRGGCACHSRSPLALSPASWRLALWQAPFLIFFF